MRSVYYVGKPAYTVVSNIDDIAFDAVTGLGSGPVGVVVQVIRGIGVKAALSFLRDALENPQHLATEIGARTMRKGMNALNDNYGLYGGGISKLTDADKREFRRNQVYVDLMGPAKTLYHTAKEDMSASSIDPMILDTVPALESVFASTKVLGYVAAVIRIADILRQSGIDLESYAPYADYLRAVNAVREANGIIPCKTEEPQPAPAPVTRDASEESRSDAVVVAASPDDLPSYCREWDKKFEEVISQRTAGDIIACLQAGADPRAKNGLRQTPLHMAVRDDEKLAVVTLLLESGANPNAQGRGGNTPAHHAAEFNNSAAAIVALANAGADLNLREDFMKQTPLGIAARSKEKRGAVITALLETGADPRAKDEFGYTPLEAAIWFGSVPENMIALKSTASPPQCRGKDASARKYFKDMSPTEVLHCAEIAGGVNAPNDNIRDIRLLHWAALSHEDPAVIEALMERGADPNALDGSKQTPLHMSAIANENPAVIDALLESGADARAQDNQGNTPLHYAASYQRSPGVIDALVDAGADAGLAMEGRLSPLHMAARHNREPAIIAALIEAGVDPNLRAGLDRTPLHEAVSHNENPAVISLLLDAGAYPNARDYHGQTPLGIAIINGRSNEIIAALAAKEEHVLDCNNWHNGELFGKMAPGGVFFCLNENRYASLSDTFDGNYTILHMVARDNNDPEVIAELIDIGFDVNAQGKFGNTPLHLAAQYNTNPAVLVTLLQAGAGPTAHDSEGRTPLQVARDEGRPSEIIEALEAAVPGR